MKCLTDHAGELSGRWPRAVCADLIVPGIVENEDGPLEPMWLPATRPLLPMSVGISLGPSLVTVLAYRGMVSRGGSAQMVGSSDSVGTTTGPGQDK